MNEFETLKTFFHTLHAKLPDEWLESCISWCKSESPHYTVEDLKKQVYEQFLLCDLKDLEVSALPPNLSAQQKYTLNGNFCLQMMQIVDISKPKLWQLQKIRNNHSLTRGTEKDHEVVGTAKRLLQMTLTDGIQDVEAMEYQAISCLSLNLAPGVKICVGGPIMVRRGRLMLKPQNILKILGGEVEAISISNAAENVLARHLKLPLNQAPGKIEERVLIVENEDKREGYVSNFDVKKLAIEKKNSPKHIQQDYITPEDLMLLEEEMDLVLEEENHVKNAPESRALNDHDDMFENIDLDAHLDQLEGQMFDKIETRTVNTVVSSPPNLLTISRLLAMKDNVSKGVFKVKATFKSIEEKLTISEGVYKLVIKIQDDSGEMVISVHSDIVAGFAEYTPTDIENLKSNIIANDEAAIEKMMKALMKVKESLIKLDNIITVTLEKNRLPVLTKIL